MSATSIVAERPVGVEGETAVKLGGSSQGSEENTIVPIASLSEMTGFPVDFIKKELLVDEKGISMKDLRETMAKYLESTMKNL